MKTIQEIIIKFTLLLALFLVLAYSLSRIGCNPQTSEIKIIKTTIKKHISKKNLIPSDTIRPDLEILKVTEFIYDTLFIYDTIYTVSDVIIDFFTKYNIKDTIDFDTLGYVYLNDSITQNTIYYRGIDYSLNSYTKIIPQKYLFKGSYGAFYMNYDTINVLGVNLSVERKKITITGGYGKDLNRLFEENNNVFLFSLQKNFNIKRN